MEVEKRKMAFQALPARPKSAKWPFGPCRPGPKMQNGLPGPAGSAKKRKIASWAFRAGRKGQFGQLVCLTPEKKGGPNFFQVSKKSLGQRFFSGINKKSWPPRGPVAWSSQPGGQVGLARLSSPAEHCGQTDIKMNDGILKMHDFRSTNASMLKIEDFWSKVITVLSESMHSGQKS